MEKVELTRGDIIRVGWVDIFEDPTGNPDEAHPALRYSYGQFWAYSLWKSVECLVTTTTEDELTHDSGFACYPWGCIVSIEVIKKKRARRKRQPIRPEHGPDAKQDRAVPDREDPRKAPEA